MSRSCMAPRCDATENLGSPSQCVHRAMGVLGAGTGEPSKSLPSLGLSLDGIAEIINLAEREVPCERTGTMLDRRVDEIDQAIDDLRRLRARITDARNRPAHTSGRCSMIES